MLYLHFESCMIGDKLTRLFLARFSADLWSVD